ncbi:Aste57867_5646 [Aphanomyces stellatus]|uniref:Aste57867_5646 protein n=1 Tax=Aphanomyces stellatus TaxID=120398 RepID=A0A485KDQ7_9STRA|nr:hypothetical protein As57867_005633 [Aphanomyces stellatus]VFT82692.1 Aste57867_5646 [Aphanomyces stellatus]
MAPANAGAANVATQPHDLSMALSRATFASHEDLFRVEIYTTGGDLPIRIWMESRRSKSQWECTVKNFETHKPSNVAYSLPSSTVLSALMTVLTCTAKRNDESCTEECERYDVDLKTKPNRRLSLQLTLEAFVGLRAEYAFELQPRAADPMDVVNAKIRDLEEEVELLKAENKKLKKKKGANATVQRLHAASAHSTNNLAHVEWSSQERLLPSVIVFNRDADVLTVKRSGLYHVEISGSSSGSNGMLVLYHNDNKMAVANAIKQDDSARHKYLVHLSVTLEVLAQSTIEICFVAKSPCNHTACVVGACGKTKLNKDAKLLVHVLGLFPDAAPAAAADNAPSSSSESSEEEEKEDAAETEEDEEVHVKRERRG